MVLVVEQIQYLCFNEQPSLIDLKKTLRYRIASFLLVVTGGCYAPFSQVCITPASNSMYQEKEHNGTKADGRLDDDIIYLKIFTIYFSMCK